MKARITQSIGIGASLIAWICGIGGCSSGEVSPFPPPQALPPAYTEVPHPAGNDMGDLRAILTSPSALKPDEVKLCDTDLKKLKSLTQSIDELSQGSRELVKADPVKYHWCFYGRLAQLEEELKAEDYLHDRQKKVLDAYEFLTPVGRAFMLEFKDSRYIRFAVNHYRHLSEWVFYRKLELTPQATAELVEAANPLGLLREPASSQPVLEKYNLAKPAVAPVLPSPEASASPVPSP